MVTVKWRQEMIRAGQHCMRERKIESRMKDFLRYSKLLHSYDRARHLFLGKKKIMEENENEENKSRDDSMDQKERDQDSSDGIIRWHVITNTC